MFFRIGAALSVSLALLAAGCGGPDADPETALRSVCGDDASVTETDSDAAVDEDYDGTPLLCRTDGHTVVAEKYKRDAEETAREYAEEYASGNGDHLVYAIVEADGGAGTVVYAYGPRPDDDEVRRADVAVLDPLDDDGWDVVDPT